MKKFSYVTMLMVLCFISCKKDTQDDGTSGAAVYTLAAPKCLLMSTAASENGDEWNMVYRYDAQKRISSITETGGKYKEEFTYSGNTMIEEVTSIKSSGEESKTIFRFELNVMGFIAKVMQEDSSSASYIYNSQGYLIRRLVHGKSGEILFGSSYQYANGNRIASYDLDFDMMTGAVIDSSLGTTYTYYTNLPGKIDEAEAWISRYGRANKNELKSVAYKTSTQEFDYTIGSNDMPSAYQIVGSPQKMKLTWTCD